MKVFILFLIVYLTLVIFDWINNGQFVLSELLPFSKTGHSFNYNYLAVLMLCIAGWGIWQLYKRKR